MNLAFDQPQLCNLALDLRIGPRRGDRGPNRATPPQGFRAKGPQFVSIGSPRVGGRHSSLAPGKDRGREWARLTQNSRREFCRRMPRGSNRRRRLESGHAVQQSRRECASPEPTTRIMRRCRTGSNTCRRRARHPSGPLVTLSRRARCDRRRSRRSRYSRRDWSSCCEGRRRPMGWPRFGMSRWRGRTARACSAALQTRYTTPLRLQTQCHRVAIAARQATRIPTIRLSRDRNDQGIRARNPCTR